MVAEVCIQHPLPLLSCRVLTEMTMLICTCSFLHRCGGAVGILSPYPVYPKARLFLADVFSEFQAPQRGREKNGQSIDTAWSCAHLESSSTPPTCWQADKVILMQGKLRQILTLRLKGVPLLLFLLLVLGGAETRGRLGTV